MCCGLRTRPRTDVDPPRFLDRTAIDRGHIVSPPPGAIRSYQHRAGTCRFCRHVYFLCQTKSKKLHVILCAEIHHYDSNQTLLLFYTVRTGPLSKQYNKHSKLLEPSVWATCYICISYLAYHFQQLLLYFVIAMNDFVLVI